MNDTQLFCYRRLLMTGEVIAIRQGEKGYFKTSYGVQSKEFVRDMNLKIGIDEATADAMGLCSLSGNWKAFESIRANMKASRRTVSV